MEKERGIEPDPDIDAFMKADAIEGKRESIETEYVLHILGLNVCADTMVSSNTTSSSSARLHSILQQLRIEHPVLRAIHFYCKLE